MSHSDFIVDATLENFDQIIQASFSVPVVIDFWAQWCGACKSLMPILERLIEHYQGRALLAKVDVDEQQMIAAQFGIRSVPTLKIFRNGKQVEELMGAQPEPVLRETIEKYMDDDVAEMPAENSLRQQAMQAYQQGQLEEAASLLNIALADEPDNYELQLDLIQVLMDLQQFDKCDELLAHLPANIQTESSVHKLQARLMFCRALENAPHPTQMVQMLKVSPEDSKTQYQLAAYLIVTGNYEQGMEILLELMRRDRRYNEDAARKGLLAVFNMLDNQGELVSRYRSKLARLLY